MAIENFLTDTRTIVTVLSLVTFIGIVAWSYSSRRAADFSEAAYLPFADDVDGVDMVDGPTTVKQERSPRQGGTNLASTENHHG